MTDYLKLMDQIDAGTSDGAPSTAPVNPNAASYYLDQMNQIDGVQPGAQAAVATSPQQNIGPLAFVNDAVNAAARGVGTSIIDKAAAALDATGYEPQQLLGLQGVPKGTNFGERYENRLAELRGLGNQFYQQYPTASAASNAAGMIGGALALPGSSSVTLPAEITRNAAIGAGYGAAGAYGDTSKEGIAAIPDVAFGAGTGAALAPVVTTGMRGISNLISPNISDDARTLLNAGITPTPGQLLGGVAKETEESAGSIPVIGKFINNARGRALSDFNKATINKSLIPIGQSLSEDTPAGNAAISEAEQKIGNVYKSILPNVTVGLDPQLQADIQAARGIAANAGRENQFDNIIKDQVLSRFKPVGQGTSDMAMSGQEWQTAKSQLGDLIRRYASSTDADQGMLGDALSNVQASLHNGLARSNPAYASEISKANASWALFKRLQDAAAYGGKNTEGVFTPAQLLSSIRKMDSSVDKGAFARGNALLQNFAQAGQSVLGNTVPNSGTANRLGLQALGVGLGTLAYSGHPEFAALGAAGVGGGAALYSKPGIAALAAALSKRPEIFSQAPEVLQNLTPAATMGATNAARAKLAQILNQ